MSDCKYCAAFWNEENDHKPIGKLKLGNIDGINIQVSLDIFDSYNNAVLDVSTSTHDHDFRINYCPICGKKLKKEERN